MLKFLHRAFRRRSPSLQERFPRYRFGRGTYGSDLRIHEFGEGATLEIGAFCSIAGGVQIFLGGEHRLDWVTTYPFNVLWPAGRQIRGHPRSKGNVTIGNDVWIGAEAVILSGVTIADGAAVGARSVVTRDVPAYTLVAGNPARTVRKRFDDETIEALRTLRWWQWDDTRIAEMMPYLLNDNPQALIRAARGRRVDEADASGR